MENKQTVSDSSSAHIPLLPKKEVVHCAFIPTHNSSDEAQRTFRSEERFTLEGREIYAIRIALSLFLSLSVRLSLSLTLASSLINVQPWKNTSTDQEPGGLPGRWRFRVTQGGDRLTARRQT